MPRKPRFAPPGYPLHLTQRGNYRQPVFFSDDDRSEFLALLDDHADLRQVLVHGYALICRTTFTWSSPAKWRTASAGSCNISPANMPNISPVGSIAAAGFGKAASTPASLDTPHFLAALAYVDLNPVRARIVTQATDYS